MTVDGRARHSACPVHFATYVTTHEEFTCKRRTRRAGPMSAASDRPAWLVRARPCGRRLGAPGRGCHRSPPRAAPAPCARAAPDRHVCEILRRRHAPGMVTGMARFLQIKMTTNNHLWTHRTQTRNRKVLLPTCPPQWSPSQVSPCHGQVPLACVLPTTPWPAQGGGKERGPGPTLRPAVACAVSTGGSKRERTSRLGEHMRLAGCEQAASPTGSDRR